MRAFSLSLFIIFIPYFEIAGKYRRYPHLNQRGLFTSFKRAKRVSQLRAVFPLFLISYCIKPLGRKSSRENRRRESSMYKTNAVDSHARGPVHGRAAAAVAAAVYLVQEQLTRIRNASVYTECHSFPSTTGTLARTRTRTHTHKI